MNTGETTAMNPETLAMLAARGRMRDVIRSMPEFHGEDDAGIKMSVDVEGYRFVAIVILAPVEKLDG